jgi:transglutaminase-like putative cysteine protease
MNRRDFFRHTGAAAFGLALSDRARLAAQPQTIERWRTFEIVTTVEVQQPVGVVRVWLPTPLAAAPYQKTLGDIYLAGSGRVVMIETTANDPDILAASWDPGDLPTVTLTSRVATTGHAADLSKPTIPPVDLATLARFLNPSRLVPIDGVVKTTADTITRGAGTDLERARAIYDWIVEHTYRKADTRGCGTGDIRVMLDSRDLGGKAADLTALFVGLARAAGIPARIVYGIRVAKSRTGARSLGLSSDDATGAQHCRAEVYLVGYGWVPVDPADVRAVMLDEPPGHLAMDDEKVRAARTRLFGSWEMNWIAYNFAQDVTLPGSKRGTVPFFMYPQGETTNGRLDSLDAAGFKYRITASEIVERP